MTNIRAKKVTDEERDLILSLAVDNDVTAIMAITGRSRSGICQVLMRNGVRPCKLKSKMVHAIFGFSMESDGVAVVREEKPIIPKKPIDEPWTPEEDSAVRDADNLFRVAEELNRDFESVKERYRELSSRATEVAPQGPIESEWTQDELALLNSDLDDLTVSRRLGLRYPYVVALRAGEVCAETGEII